MSNPTSNFGWQMPTNSDLVTDLPADFEVFGQGVDTTLADLKGGTTGQILSKATNADMDFTWTNLNPGDITGVTATSPLTGGGTSGDVTVGIQDGTTSQKGAVQLEDSTSSTSTTKAATPNSVKTSYDLANAAIPKSLVDAKGDIVTATADNTPARLAAGNNGESLVADSTTSSGLAYTAANTRGNPIINSGMDVWQRGTSVSGSGSLFAADRWNFFRESYASGITVSRQTTNDTTNLPNIQYCQRVQRDAGNTATNGLQTTYNMETIDSIRFAGKTITFSFYARKGANFSNVSSVMNASVYYGTGTDQALRSGYTNQAQVISQNLTLTTTWQRFSYTGSVPSTSTQLGINFFYTPSGTAGAADYFEVTGVQIDLSSTALPYRKMNNIIQGELAACQRYYYRSTAGTNYAIFGIGNALSTTGAMMQLKFPVTMRTRPTAIEYGGTIQLFDGVTATNITSATINTDLVTSTDLANFRATVASGLTQYRPYQIAAAADATAYFGFSAEL